MKYATFDSSVDVVVLPAVATGKYLIHGFCVAAYGDVDINLRTGSTVIVPVRGKDGSAFVLPVSRDGYADTAVNADVNIDVSAAIRVVGTVFYTLV